MQRKARLGRPAGCHPDLAGVVVSERALARRVRELGAEISRDYAGQEILLVGVLRGAVVFLADLARAISVPVRVDCLSAASYGAGTTSSGRVRITRDLEEPLAGRHVLVVDTVLDTGLTLRALDAALRARGPASLRYCVLLHKDRGGPPPFAVDYVGFTIPDRFVVGYGLDYAQRFRNLPYIGILRREIYEGTS
ncbi:MAG TPA: hypoxanthine phosphoribosyltransferase [Chloroflexota bacterium]|nr:hypoxanthine phosphoribosyltransferase [Chloroflexota bacterium]